MTSVALGNLIEVPVYRAFSRSVSVVRVFIMQRACCLDLKSGGREINGCVDGLLHTVISC